MLKILIGFLSVFTMNQLFGQQTTCIFHKSDDHWNGQCAGQTATFTIVPSDSITSGIWRKDINPMTVWKGTMHDSENSDSPIEIEIYSGRYGVLRTLDGWFSVAGYSSTNNEIKFQLDTTQEVPPSALDWEIIKLADSLLSSDSVWNKFDNRKCSPTATKLSIYCAMERATIQVTGGFHHRRPALELVREIVEQRTIGRHYHHRLMDFNNDPSTTLEDVHDIFKKALMTIRR
jgi:hypothetical protein